MTDDVEDVGAEEGPEEAKEEGEDFVVAEFADGALGGLGGLWWSCASGDFSRVFRGGILVLGVLVLFEGIFWYVVLNYTRLG